MKFAQAIAVLAAATLLSACASSRQIAVLALVGPPSFEQPRHGSQGQLVVYSALESGGSSIRHADYWLNSGDGRKLKFVNNSVSLFVQDPAILSLAPGRYSVTARATADGTVTVPLVIEAGKTTSVHLDGSKLADGRQTSESDLVHLPDGWIVGWRAKESGEVK